jgi:hypothetical protein
MAVIQRRVAGPIWSVLSSSRNLRLRPLYPWYRATAMKIAPAAPTIHCPSGQPRTPAADVCGLLELWLAEPSRMVTASAHMTA